MTARIPKRYAWRILSIGLLLAFLACKIDHGLDPGFTGDGSRAHITFNLGALGYVLISETVSEGETYEVPEATLTGLASVFQSYWDAVEGTTMTIPYGALNEDIVVNIQVSNFDLMKGGFKALDGERIFLSLDYTVEGHEGEAFLFNEGHEMVFTLPLDAEMLPLLQAAGFDLSTPLTLAYWTGSTFVIIPTVQTERELIGKVPYLATIVGKAVE